MSAIGATNSSVGDALVALLRSGSGAETAPPESAPSKPPAKSGTGGDSEAATTVSFSDHAKATLARAKREQFVADRLAAQVAAAKNPAGKNQAASSSNKTSISFKPVSFEDLGGTSEADTSAPVITAPSVTFTSTLQFGGFSVSATGNADTWSSDIRIDGPNGLEITSTVFGGGKGRPTASVSGAKGLNGLGYVGGMTGDNKMYFTLSSASAEAAAVTTGDSLQGAASAHLSALTFIVDFSTGKISVEQADATATTAMSTVR